MARNIHHQVGPKNSARMRSRKIKAKMAAQRRWNKGAAPTTPVPDDLYFRIQRAGDRLVSNASSLIENSTSNLAECFMGIRCKFDGGKVINRIQRGSFQYRCNGAGLRFQLGPDWTSQVWHSVTGQQPLARKKHDELKRTHDNKVMTLLDSG